VIFLVNYFAVFPTDWKSALNYAFSMSTLKFLKKMHHFLSFFQTFKPKLLQTAQKNKNPLLYMCLRISFCLHIQSVMLHFSFNFQNHSVLTLDRIIYKYKQVLTDEKELTPTVSSTGSVHAGTVALLGGTGTAQC
jgi:hypothetical protein